MLESFFSTRDWLIWLFIVVFFVFNLYDKYKKKKRSVWDYVSSAVLVVLIVWWVVSRIMGHGSLSGDAQPVSRLVLVLIFLAYGFSLYNLKEERTRRNAIQFVLFSVFIALIFVGLFLGYL